MIHYICLRSSPQIFFLISAGYLVTRTASHTAHAILAKNKLKNVLLLVDKLKQKNISYKKNYFVSYK